MKHKENIFKESKDFNFALIDKDISTEMIVEIRNRLRLAGTLWFYYIIMALKII